MTDSDRNVWPAGVRPARRGEVTWAYLLGVLLFIATLGAGYLAWSVFTWGGGQTPAQRLRGLRCWVPETGQLAGRRRMALRQVTGLLLNGECLAGPLLLLLSENLNSVGDVVAATVVLHDPDDALVPPVT
jgi:uncharacterized RDD family membrane protein YckC